MNVDWFVLKLVDYLRKTCGWSMRQPLRGGKAGAGLPPSTLAGALGSGSGPWHRSKHTGRSRGLTLSLVLVGVRGQWLQSRGLGPPGQAAGPELGSGRSRCGPKPLPHCIFSGSYR